MPQPTNRRIITEASLTVALDAEAALARNADNLTSGLVADARIPSSIARDTEVTDAVAAEAALARNADNLISGLVSDARIPSTITRDSELTSALTSKADLASPVLTGNPTAPTPGSGDNDTSIATTAWGIGKGLVDAKGDLIVASASDVPTRLAAGVDGQALVADSAETTGLKWATVSGTGISPTIVDSKGDIIVASANDTVVRKAVGSNGSRLVADSVQSDGLRWTTSLYFEGSGSPEGVVTASIGSTYADTTNGLFYIKKTGAGNTGWVSARTSGLTGIGSIQHLIKTASESVTSNITLQDDNHLFFTAEANAVYEVDFVLVSDSAQNYRFALSIPSGTYSGILEWGGTGAGEIGMYSYAVWQAVTDDPFTAAAYIQQITVRVAIGGTGGTVKLRWAQSSSSGTPSTLFADSWLTARRVA